MTNADGCPPGPGHPRPIWNPPGRDRLDYRVGDFDSFRTALLRPREAEAALAEWQPSAGTDLAVQLVEWWAYLADVLTFYNERVIEGAFLSTARHADEIRRITRLLGYRPRPGIGASGTVAALTDSPRPFVVPHGFPIQGKAAPGAAEQVFEVDDDIPVGRLGHPLPSSSRIPSVAGTAATRWTGPAPTDARGRLLDSLPAHAVPGDVQILAGEEFELVLRGAITTVTPDDVLIVLPQEWSPGNGHVHTLVRAVEQARDAAGRAITTLRLLPDTTLADVRRGELRLMRATQVAHLWLFHQRYPESDNLGLVVAGQAANVVQSFAELAVFGGAGLLFGGNPFADLGPPEDPRPIAGAPMDPTSTFGHAHFEAITRGLAAGDIVLFESLGEGGLFGQFESFLTGLIPGFDQLVPRSALVEVAGYSEEIWYANAPQIQFVGYGPPVGPPRGPDGFIGSLVDGAEGPIPIPHSKITFPIDLTIDVLAARGKDTIVAHYGWKDVGEIVEPESSDPTSKVTIDTTDDVPPEATVPVLVEDVTGGGVPGHLGSTGIVIDHPVRPPLRALLHLLPVSRGKTVEREVLGSGDATMAGQEFALQRSPLTYLSDTGPSSANGYRSTLRVRVDGIEWKEVRSFYRQPPDAMVFVTREDDEQRTHLRFGDGVNGRRLPTGVDNVVARYRHGSGETTPIPGSLTSMLRPVDGVTAIRNPVPVGGGEDPDPPERMRELAPASVLHFGRVVSSTDYETIAAQTPGVRRAASVWSWHTPSQRMLVRVFVGDDQAAVEATRAAFGAFADPNRPVVVERAISLPTQVGLTVLVDPLHDPITVEQGVRDALLAPRSTPFGSDVVRIGETVHDSEISLACSTVAGVVGVESVTVSVGGTIVAGERHSPGEGRFFDLQPDGLRILVRQVNRER